MLPRFCPACFGVLFCSVVLGCRCTSTTYRVVSGASFLTWDLSVTMHIVDLWQYYVCCIRSGASRCTPLTAIYLCCTCKYGLHSLLWSLIDILMPFFAAGPRSTAGLSFLSQYLLEDLGDPAFDGVGLAGFKSTANAFLFA